MSCGPPRRDGRHAWRRRALLATSRRLCRRGQQWRTNSAQFLGLASASMAGSFNIVQDVISLLYDAMSVAWNNGGPTRAHALRQLRHPCLAGGPRKDGAARAARASLSRRDGTVRLDIGGTAATASPSEKFLDIVTATLSVDGDVTRVTVTLDLPAGRRVGHEPRARFDRCEPGGLFGCRGGLNHVHDHSPAVFYREPCRNQPAGRRLRRSDDIVPDAALRVLTGHGGHCRREFARHHHDSGKRGGAPTGGGPAPRRRRCVQRVERERGGGAGIQRTSTERSAQLRGALSIAQTAATIERTQTINLLRESLFRTCERYLSGGMGPAALAIQAGRDLRAIIAVLAIGNSRATTRPPSTVISAGRPRRTSPARQARAASCRRPSAACGCPTGEGGGRADDLRRCGGCDHNDDHNDHPDPGTRPRCCPAVVAPAFAPAPTPPPAPAANCNDHNHVKRAGRHGRVSQTYASKQDAIDAASDRIERPRRRSTLAHRRDLRRG